MVTDVANKDDYECEKNGDLLWLDLGIQQLILPNKKYVQGYSFFVDREMRCNLRFGNLFVNEVQNCIQVRTFTFCKESFHFS